MCFHEHASQGIKEPQIKEPHWRGEHTRVPFKRTKCCVCESADNEVNQKTLTCSMWYLFNGNILDLSFFKVTVVLECN